MRARPAFWIVASIALLLGSACIPSPIPHPPRPPQPPSRPNLPPPSPSPSYSGDMHAAYRNIKVLHGPASGLDSIMREFNTALGVQCSYCHLQDKWEEDIPMKEKARMMVTLSNQESDKLTKGEISCWTCHRGKALPDTLPALKPESPETVAAVRAIGLTEQQEEQPVRRVLKNLKELGGSPAGNLPFPMGNYTKPLEGDSRSCLAVPFQ